jgi:hypothetical protein
MPDTPANRVDFVLRTSIPRGLAVFDIGLHSQRLDHFE